MQFGSNDEMAWIAIVAVIALIEYIWLSIRVGASRGRDGVDAPATTGNETFERHYRVQHNTLEQLIIFLPALFILRSLFARYRHLIRLILRHIHDTRQGRLHRSDCLLERCSRLRDGGYSSLCSGRYGRSLKRLLPGLNNHSQHHERQHHKAGR